MPWYLAPRRRALLGPCLLLALCVLSLPGCGNLSARRIGQKRIAKHLQSILGPADRYDVRIQSGGGTDLMGGKISRLTVSGAGIHTRGGLVVDRIQGELSEVRFNRRRESVDAVGASTLLATVTEASATSYLGRREGSLNDLKLTLTPGRVKLSGKRALTANLALPLSLEGTFVLDGPSRVRFEPDSLSVARLSVPKALLSIVEERVNPVFNLESLKLPLALEQVEVGLGEVVLRGHLVVPPGGLLGRAAPLPRDK
ncbi:MAG TPA: DUF2993 domain-containing protein [Armatimonadota bacterium]